MRAPLPICSTLFNNGSKTKFELANRQLLTDSDEGSLINAFYDIM